MATVRHNTQTLLPDDATKPVSATAWNEDHDVTLVDADIPATIARDAEVAAAYQPLDSDLTAIAALATTAFGRSLLVGVATAGADCTGDGTLAANVLLDAPGCSISLTAGTWQIWGQVSFTTVNAALSYCLGAITDAANANVAEARALLSSAGVVTVACFGTVTPGSTTTYKLRGQTATAGDTISRYSSGTQIGTRIWALRVA